MSPMHPKYCPCHASWSPCTRSKLTAASQNKTFGPFEASSKFTKHFACHETWPPKSPLVLTQACQRFSNVRKIPRVPRGWSEVLHLPRQTCICRIAPKTDTPRRKDRPSKMILVVCTFYACTSHKDFCANRRQQNDQPATRTLNKPRLDPFRKNPSVWTHCLGNEDRVDHKDIWYVH